MDANSFHKTIEALTLISEAITSDRFIEDVLRLIVIVTAETLDSQVCSLWLLDEKTRTITIRATQSINRDYIKERSLKVGEGIVGLVAQENRHYMCLDVLADPHFKEKDLARRMELSSMLSVPMSVKERVIGVINCYSTTKRNFNATEVNLLTAVANQAAVAIYNTELIVKTQVIREELEARKMVERAKDIIISKKGVTGDEAYRLIQKRAMDSRKSKHQVAEAIILAEEL